MFGTSVRVGDALARRSLDADGVVQRERADDGAVFQLAGLRSLGQRGGVKRGGHLGVDLLDGAEAGDHRIIVAECVCHADGVAEDLLFRLKVGGDVHGRVGQQQQAVKAGHLKQRHMRQHLRIPQTVLLVQNRLENDGGIDKALHHRVGFAVFHERDRNAAGRGVVRFVDDAVRREIERVLGGDAADLLLAADQNGLRDPQTVRLVNSKEHVVVLRAGNGKALCALRTGRRAERFDGFDHRNPPLVDKSVSGKFQ